MTSSQVKYYPLKLGLLISTLAILVLVSLTSFWLQSTIFDTDNFTAMTTQAVGKESSRRSIGELVAGRIFEKTPTLRTVFSDRLAEHIAGTLDTDRAKSSIDRLARESQLLVTSPQREPVTIDLTGIKTSIASAQSLTGRTEDNARINVDNIPDEVVLIDTAELPSIHQQAVMVVWAGPLSLMLAIGLAIWWVLRASYRQARLFRIKIVLLSVALGSLFAITLGPLVEPPFIALGRDAPSQTLMRNVYEAFMSPFYRQAILIGMSAVFVTVVMSVWQWLARRYTVSFAIEKKSL